MVISELSNIIDCIDFMLVLQIIIILAVLIAANIYLYKSEKMRKVEEKEELLKLKRKLIQEGVAENEINEDDLKDEIAPKPRYAWIFGIVVCLDIWIVGAVFTHLWAGTFFTEVDPNDNRKALFGDSFGAVNALISAFAFAGLIVAFIIQRYELRLQWKELKNTREELRGQKVEFEMQNKTLRRECFENTFFSMLQMQQTITEGLILHNRERNPHFKKEDFMTYPEYIYTSVKGREVFHKIYDNNSTFQLLSNGWRDYGGLLETLRHNGYNWFAQNDELTFLDHYFRHLYRIIKYVDDNKDIIVFAEEGKEDEVRYSYVSILRATLSDYELGCLFYNCLSQNGRAKFKPLVEKYSFFNNIRDKVLLDPEKDKNEYATKAFNREA